jgi:cell division septation protein DedD
LTTLFDQAAVQVIPAIDAPPVRKRNSWLPLLTVLFLISYGIMTMLIVEQGATIESQRALIRELFKDSAELSATRIKSAQATAAEAHSAQVPAAKAQSAAPVPSTQAPAKQAPSSQVGPQAAPQHRVQNQKTPFQMPSRPASDFSDDRRALIKI